MANIRVRIIDPSGTWGAFNLKVLIGIPVPPAGPVDTTAPLVVGLLPASGSSNIPVVQPVSVRFGEAIATLTVNANTFRVVTNDGIASGISTLLADGMTARFTPASPFPHDRECHAQIDGIRDLAGNLAPRLEWRFRTAPAPDQTPPTIVGIYPASGTLLATETSAVEVVFDEAIASPSVTPETFSIMNGSTIASGLIVLRDDGRRLVFMPHEGFPFDRLITVRLRNGIADLAGNSLASDFTWQFKTPPVPETLRPAVAFVSSAPELVSESPLLVEMTFSRPVTGVDPSDLDVMNCVVRAFSGTAGSYSFELQPLNPGTFSASLRPGAGIDTYNYETLPGTFTRVFLIPTPTDRLRPSVMFIAAASRTTSLSRINIDANFSEPVTGFFAGDLLLANAAIADFTGSGAYYSFALLPAGQGTCTVVIPADAYADLYGNPGHGATFSLFFDSIRPAGSLVSFSPWLTSIATIPMLVGFDEPVLNFTADEIVVTNGMLGNFSLSGATCTFDIYANTIGTVTAWIPAGVANDPAGNPNAEIATITRFYQPVVPSLAMVATDAAVTSNSLMTVHVLFAEPVTGFDGSDLVLTNATVSAFSGSGATYTFSLVSTGQGTATAYLPPDTVFTAGGLGNPPATFTRFVDTIRPRGVIFSTAPNQTLVATIPIEITFSEPLFNFDSNDILVGNGFMTNLQIDGQRYTFDVLALASGPVDIFIPSGVARDAAGNPNMEVATMSWLYQPSVPAGTIDLGGGALMSFVDIPGGTFIMGSPESEPGRYSDEGPQHQVTISPFRMQTTHVTQGQYMQVMGVNPSFFVATQTIFSSGYSDTTNLPVEQVNWYDAIRFCNKLSNDRGLVPCYANAASSTLISDGDAVTCNWNANGFRLPTEAEWEYACRAGTSTSFYWGDSSDEATMKTNIWYQSNCAPDYWTEPHAPKGGTQPVGTKPRNPFGLYDMGGNIWDLCWDGYAAYSAGAVVDPRGDDASLMKVARGSWFAQPWGECRSARRAYGSPEPRSYGMGFRLARSSISSLSVSMTATDTAVTNSHALLVNVAFADAVTGFDSSDLVLTNATVNGFSGGGSIYSFSLEPSGQGTATAYLPANTVFTAGGLGNSPATFSRVVDTLSPGGVLFSLGVNPTSIATIPMSVGFDEPLLNFTADDIVVTNGMVGNFSLLGATCTFYIHADASGPVTAWIPAGVANDPAGNPNVEVGTMTIHYEIPAVPVQPGFPSASSTVISLNPALQAMPFSDPNTGDRHLITDWELYDDPGLGMGNLVWSRYDEATRLTSIVVDAANGSFTNALTGKTALRPGTSYWMRIRYHDDAGMVSNWSDPAIFTTIAPTLESISLTPASLTVLLNEQIYLPASITVSAQYSDASSSIVTGVTWTHVSGGGLLASSSFFTGSASGAAVLRCGYTNGIATKTADLSVVYRPTLVGITLATTTLSLVVEKTFSLASITVLAAYTDGSSRTIDLPAWNNVSGVGTLTGTIYSAPFRPGVATISCVVTDGDQVANAELTIVTTVPAIEWEKTYGGTGLDSCIRASLTSDGGNILVGNTSSTDGDVTGSIGNDDILLLKTSSTGVLSWVTVMGGTSVDSGNSVIELSDGRYLVGGHGISTEGVFLNTHSVGYNDIALAWCDAAGSLIWSHNLGGSLADRSPVIRQIEDTGYIFGGVSDSSDGDVPGTKGWNDVWIARLATDGMPIWSKSFGGSQPEEFADILRSSDGNFLFSASTDSSDGDVVGSRGAADAWIVKLDTQGNILWKYCIGGSGSDYVRGNILENPDGSLVFVGRTSSNDGDVSGNHGNYDVWVFKLDGAGSLLWSRCFGGPGGDEGRFIQKAPSGGYVITGECANDGGDIAGNHGSSDLWVIRIDEAGNLLWQKPIGGSVDEYGAAIFPTPDGGYLIHGGTNSSDGNVSMLKGSYDFWSVKLK